MKSKLLNLIFNFLIKYIINPVRRYFSLTEKELKVLLKDKIAIIITYLIPLIVVFLLSLNDSSQLISTDSTQSTVFMKNEIPKIGLIDLDNSDGFVDRDLSSELVQKFVGREELGECELFQTSNYSILENMIGAGEISAFIVIPQLFEFNLSIHLPVILPFVIDSLDALQYQASQLVVDSVITEFKNEPENNFNGVFNVEEHNVNLYEDHQIFYASISTLIPLLLFSIGCLISSQAIVSDIPKDRMVLTPTNKFEMMAAKVTANFIIQLGVVLILVGSCFIIPLKIGSTWREFLLIGAILSLNSVLLGVALSAIAKTPLSAFQFYIFLLIFQFVALFFVENPVILNLLPIYNGNELIIQVVLRGDSLWSTRLYLQNIIIETTIVYFLSFAFFKIQKTML
ncbi:MAG: ABC transporter permease [Promethearchaeota archaeon]